jgi:ABC-type phosphonate transport system ATPase subunit
MSGQTEIIGRSGTGRSRVLALCEASLSDDGGTVIVHRVVQGVGELLCYLFAEGRREVLVRGAAGTHVGTLRTKLSGTRRTWFIELQESGMPSPAATAEGAGAEVSRRV